MKQTSRAKGYDVVTIGSATRDIFVHSTHFARKRDGHAPDGWDTCLPLGAKIPVEEIIYGIGGGGANAAVTFARFGYRTACISRVGEDAEGADLVAQLNKERVDMSFVQVDPKVATAHSIVLLSESGNRSILDARGASKNIDEKCIPWKQIQTSWIYLASITSNHTLLKDIFNHARRMRAHIAWNLGGAEIEFGFTALHPYLMHSDIVSMNRAEAAALTNVSPRDLDSIFKKLGSLPRMAFVLTDGAHGAYVHSRGITWHAKALTGKRVNTTGAGDAFSSSFVASLMKDGDIEQALRVGTLNAFGVISHMGAKAGILHHLPTQREARRVRITSSS